MRLRIGIAASLLALVGCAPSPSRGVSDDVASYKIPAIKDAVQKHDRASLTQMVADLDDDDPAVRFYAFEGLRRLTGESFDYRYYDDPVARQPAIAKWKQWLETQKK